MSVGAASEGRILRVAAMLAAGALFALVAPSVSIADTLDWALIQAYQNNPQLNAQRAALRAQDEAVPQALSGYRPTLSLTASAGAQNQSTLSKAITDSGAVYSGVEAQFTPHSVGLTVNQSLFNGYQTANRVRQAEAQVSAGRATLAVTEQTTLLNAVGAYMNLIRDIALLELQRRNVVALEEQLRATRERLRQGDVTKTDVAQAQSRLEGGRAQVLQAGANLLASKAAYRQAIGVEPGNLAPASPVDRLVPGTLAAAIAQGRQLNPNVAAAMFGIDAALLQVKINQGALAPSVTANANVQQQWEIDGISTYRQFNATLTGQVTVPIYQGGAEFSAIRAANETLGQQRFGLDVARDQVQAAVMQAWGQREAAKAQIEATRTQVDSAALALVDVRKEAMVGQRTTLDILNAQQELLNAQVARVIAEHDRVVASYSLLAATGGLSIPGLGLKTTIYDPSTHYHHVRDAWGGLHSMDGR